MKGGGGASGWRSCRPILGVWGRGWLTVRSLCPLSESSKARSGGGGGGEGKRETEGERAGARAAMAGGAATPLPVASSSCRPQHASLRRPSHAHAPLTATAGGEDRGRGG